MPAGLTTIIDFIRYAATRFGQAGLCFGHGVDNALDEATSLVLGSLSLPPDMPPMFAQATLLESERILLRDRIEQRISDRIPVAYLTGTAWFAGLPFKIDQRALVPRSPIAELIEADFAPWVADGSLHRALELCTGSGCIAVAMAAHDQHLMVDAVDISPDALALAAENVAKFEVGDRVRLVQSDLFAAVQVERYDLIVSNPPYVTRDECAALPAEYAHEPMLGLVAGEDGLDLALRILVDAADQLNEKGVLIVEVGEAEGALVALLPEVPFEFIEFAVGQMGVFAIDRATLVEHSAAIAAAAGARPRSA